MTKIQKPQNITTRTVKFQVNWIYRNWDDKKKQQKLITVLPSSD